MVNGFVLFCGLVSTLFARVSRLFLSSRDFFLYIVYVVAIFSSFFVTAFLVVFVRLVLASAAPLFRRHQGEGGRGDGLA